MGLYCYLSGLSIVKYFIYIEDFFYRGEIIFLFFKFKVVYNIFKELFYWFIYSVYGGVKGLYGRSKNSVFEGSLKVI